MALNLDNLTPEDQNALSQLFQKAQQQSAPTPQVAGQQGVETASQLPAPGSFRDNPKGAIDFITQQLGQQLQLNKQGKLSVEAPRQGLLPRLFLGKTQQVPLSDPTNYFSSMTDLLGEDEAKSLLPKNAPREPGGMPFITKEVFETVMSKLSHKKGKDDAGSPELAQALEAKAVNSGVPTNVIEPLRRQWKKFPPSSKQIGDYEKILTEWKDTDIVKAEDGRTYLYDRRSGQSKPFLPNAEGIIKEMSPLEIRIFDKRMTAYDNDPVIKENRKAIDLLGNVSSLLESNNPAAIGVLFSNIAKSVGKEAGVLTEGDIARAVGDPAWGAQLYRWYNKRADIINGKGQLSDKDLKDFRGLFKDIAGGAKKRFDAVTEQHVKRTASMLPGISADRIREAMTVEVPFMEADQRVLPGQATNYVSPTSAAPTPQAPLSAPATVAAPTGGQTRKGTKYRVIK